MLHFGFYGTLSLLIGAFVPFCADSAVARGSDSRAAAALADLRRDDLRAAAIGWRLTTANDALCRDHAAQAGLVIYDAALFPAAVRPVAQALFRLDGPATIAAVAPGSAAARAGLAPGDALDAVDGIPLSAEPVAAAGSFAGVARTLATLDAAYARGAATLAIRRSGIVRTVRFVADRGCLSDVQIVPGRRFTGGADGRTISITSALADAAQDDDELAVVIGHEMAHNILHHHVRLEEAGVGRGLFAGLGTNGAALRTVEDEADRVGLWLAARAGYDPAAGARFWARFGRRTDPIISDGTHSGWRKRVAKLTAVAAEIDAARAAGRPLVPPPPPVLPLP